MGAILLCVRNIHISSPKMLFFFKKFQARMFVFVGVVGGWFVVGGLLGCVVVGVGCVLVLWGGAMVVLFVFGFRGLPSRSIIQVHGP